jgi:hypothetical protein
LPREREVPVRAAVIQGLALAVHEDDVLSLLARLLLADPVADRAANGVPHSAIDLPVGLALRRPHRRVSHPLRELGVGSAGNGQGNRSEQSEEKEAARNIERGPEELLHIVSPMFLVSFHRLCWDRS